jgi:ribose/xylose/arabinose/galactoside ABC-type transport system permease subunit
VRRLPDGLGTILLLDLAALLLFSMTVPAFLSAANLQALALSALALLLLATGQTIVLISGGIDLSAPAVVGLASVAGALVMSEGHGLLSGAPLAGIAGIAAMLAVGSGAGVLNGLAIGMLRIPPFMATLTMATFAAGLAVWLARYGAGTETLYGLPRLVTTIGRTPLLMIGLTLLALALVHVVLEHTVLGRSIRAAGFSPATARVSGVRILDVIVRTYMLSGALAALAALIITAQLETASPAHGRPLLLDVIGASVIGGTSLAGGVGTIAATALGVAFLALLGNGLTLLNLSDFVITIVKGLVILAAALVDVWRRRHAIA